MNIHEYQAKAVLRAFSAPVSNGRPAFTPEEAEAAAKELGGSLWVVKSQIHAGGRGKGKFKEASAGEKGGVRLAKSVEEVRQFAKQMLGRDAGDRADRPARASRSTGSISRKAPTSPRSSISPRWSIARRARIAFVLSTEGGVNIEDVAHKTPEKILTFSIDPATGIMPHHGRTAARRSGSPGDLAKQCEALITRALCGLRRQGHGDARDQPAGRHHVRPAQGARRQGFVRRQRACSAIPTSSRCATRPRRTPKEIEASKYDLNYVALDGTIGCMVNGAGLAMATMDIIKLYGESPANFLDVGGGATKEKVTAAFKIITADPT